MVRGGYILAAYLSCGVFDFGIKAPFYLFKSEPSAYSIDALENEKDSTTEWDGKNKALVGKNLIRAVSRC